MAKYKKKRARELKHDRFRDATMLVADRLAERVAGRGRQIGFGLVAVILVSAGVYGFWRWREGKSQEAEQAMGRAITISTAQVTASPIPGSREVTFTTEHERAQKAIAEFQKVAAAYGDPYRSEAEYFIATNYLITEPAKGLSELERLSQSSGEVAVLAKFALAQVKENEKSYDQAAKLYDQIAQLNSPAVTPDSARLRLAIVYKKQGKAKEAGDLFFSIVEDARKARDKDNKPIPESAAAREAAQELQKLDPTRFAQLPPSPAAELAF